MLPRPPSSTLAPRWLTAILCAGLVCAAATASAEAPETAPLPPPPPAETKGAAEPDPVTAPLPESSANTKAGAAPREDGAADEADGTTSSVERAEAPAAGEDAGSGTVSGVDGGDPPDDEDAATDPAGAAAAEGDADTTALADGAPAHEVDEPSGPVVIGPPEDGPRIDAAADATCEAELIDLGAVFEPVQPLTGEGPCGAPRPLTLSAVGGIEISPPVTGRCGVMRALALWVDRVAAPLADLYMDRSLSAVLTATDYECRRRRGATTSKWSEHAFANAVDVTGVLFTDGMRLSIEPREGSTEPARAYQAGIRGGACAFFTTVLGPTTNAAHADHLHLDMAERTGGYRLCE